MKIITPRYHQQGFTLIEIMVVIGVLAVLMAVVLIAVNPGRQFRQASDAQRRNDVNAILSAVYQYATANRGQLPVDEGGPPDVALDAFQYTVNEPAGTDIQFQIASSSDGSAWSPYVGPDGTAATYYSSATYPNTTTPPPGLPMGRYFRYQATFTGNGTATPTLSDASFVDGTTTLTQTTQAQFNANSPTLTNTAVTNTAGGEVTLNTSPVNSWDIPPTATGVYNAPGNEDGAEVFVDDAANRAYLADGTTLSILNITNKAAPTLVASVTAGGTINDIYVSGGYAYLATTDNARELTIVNLTTNTIVTCANCDLSQATDATTVFISGGYLYLGRAASGAAGSNEFNIFNLGSSATNPPVSASLNMTPAVNSIYVSGNYAYLATSNTAGELTILNVSNPAVTPTTVTCAASACNLAGTAVATDVFVVGSTVYVTRNVNTGAPELSIVSVALVGNNATVSALGSYEANANITSIQVANNRAFLSTTVANQQLTILNVTNPGSIPAAVTYNQAANANNVFQAGNYVYLANASNTEELRIVQASTVAGYVTSGSYTTGAFFDFGSTPTTIAIGATPLIIGQAAAVPGNGTHIDLCSALVTGSPSYIAQLPTDPISGSGTCAGGDLNTNYTIQSAGPNRVTITAPGAEGGETISVTR